MRFQRCNYYWPIWILHAWASAVITGVRHSCRVDDKYHSRIARYYELVQRYGHDFIPAQMSYQAFKDIVRPDIPGFTEFRRGTYARSATPHIFHIQGIDT